MRALKQCAVVVILLCSLQHLASSKDFIQLRHVARGAPLDDETVARAAASWQRLNLTELKRLVVAKKRKTPPVDDGGARMPPDRYDATAIPRPKYDAVQAIPRPKYDAVQAGGFRRFDAAQRDAINALQQDSEYAVARKTVPYARTRQKRPGRTKFVLPTAAPHPNASIRGDVLWVMEDNSFIMRPSEDQSLKIRMGPPPAEGSPWPMPRLYRPMKLLYHIREAEFCMHAMAVTCDVLETAFERTRRNAFVGGGASANSGEAVYADGRTVLPVIYHLNVTVGKPCVKYPHLDMDESYDLEVKKSGVTIRAREVWGALRGLETFSQLVYLDAADHFIINRTYISDAPRFAHRGVLVDTARHYMSKQVLINNLEAMAQNKFNVFHWHIVDDQSFPYQSKVLPNLTAFGAYHPRTHVYTHEDITEIVNEARLRGIRVIPEFDSPGHTLSWGYGTDHLLTPCYNYAERPNGFYGPVNPILKWTYTLMQRLFAEVMELFPDSSIHLGGDEVPYECWTSNPFIKRFMQRNNMNDVKELLFLYETRLLNIIDGIGKRQNKHVRPIVWQEVYDDNVPVGPNTIVQMWKGQGYDLQAMVEAGQKVIYSTCWYLDYISYGQDWQKYYNCDGLLSFEEYGSKNTSNLIGGEACMWTEFVDDVNIMPRLWPRATAIAERLWSSATVNDVGLAAPRIEEQRCRMRRRGLDVGVLNGPGYCKDVRQTASSAHSWSYFARLLKLGQGSYDKPFQGHANNKVYVVDMNAMYLVPLVIVVSICCLTLLSVLQDTSRSRIITFFLLRAPGTSRLGVRGLLYVFIMFAFVWCVWTAPIWMNVWEQDTHTPAGNTLPVT